MVSQLQELFVNTWEKVTLFRREDLDRRTGMREVRYFLTQPKGGDSTKVDAYIDPKNGYHVLTEVTIRPEESVQR